jgi:hypothetical protein
MTYLWARPSAGQSALLEHGTSILVALMTAGPGASGPDAAAAVARSAAELMSDPRWEEINRLAAPDRCAGLAAAADAVDRLRTAAHAAAAGTVAWCADLDPPFGELAGAAVSRALPFPDPLQYGAQIVRAAGTICCAADGRLGDCACVRGLPPQLTEAAFHRLITAAAARSDPGR